MTHYMQKGQRSLSGNGRTDRRTEAIALPPVLTRSVTKLSSTENRGQPDRVTTPTRAGLCRCRPQHRHAALLAALARS